MIPKKNENNSNDAADNFNNSLIAATILLLDSIIAHQYTIFRNDKPEINLKKVRFYTIWVYNH
jgi:hypothetical protein